MGRTYLQDIKQLYRDRSEADAMEMNEEVRGQVSHGAEDASEELELVEGTPPDCIVLRSWASCD